MTFQFQSIGFAAVQHIRKTAFNVAESHSGMPRRLWLGIILLLQVLLLQSVSFVPKFLEQLTFVVVFIFHCLYKKTGNSFMLNVRHI